MTRINVVAPESLTRQHLLSEIRELPRVMTLARKSTQDYRNRYQWALRKHPPKHYVLGTGHVNFFVDKIAFLNKRYKALCNEWRNRGYNINQVEEKDLLEGIDSSFLNDYDVTQEAITLNTQRINERLEK